MEQQLFAPRKFEVIYNLDAPAPKWIKSDNDVDKILDFLGILYDRNFKDDFSEIEIDRDTLELTVAQNRKIIMRDSCHLLKENEINLPCGETISEYDATKWLSGILDNISDESEIILRWM